MNIIYAYKNNSRKIIVVLPGNYNLVKIECEKEKFILDHFGNIYI